MSKAARRFQLAGAVALLVSALLYGLAHSGETPPEMTELVALERHMADVRIDMGFGERWSPSMKGVVNGLVISMGLSFVFMGLTNILACRAERTTGDSRLASQVLVLTAIVNGALFGAFAWSRVLPPTVLLGIAELLLLVSLALRARSPSRV